MARLPGQIPDGLTEVSIPKNIAFSVCNVQSVTAVETLGVEHSIVPGIPTCSMSAMTSKEWVACQKGDPDLGVLIGHLYGSLKSDPKSKVAKQMLRDRKKFSFRNGVLYKYRSDDGDKVFQLVVPAKFHLQGLQGVHDEVGHVSREGTFGFDPETILLVWNG